MISAQAVAMRCFMPPEKVWMTLWRKLLGMMTSLGQRLQDKGDDYHVSEAENDQVYLTGLLR